MSEKKGQIKAGLETNVLPETNFKKERINFIKFVNKNSNPKNAIVKNFL